MVVNIITNEDLQEFRRELVEEIRGLLAQRQSNPQRQWLKSHEVRRLLLISPTKLQSLRESGSLPYTKVGGTMFYAYEDIQRMLEEHKHNKFLLSKKPSAKSFDDPVDAPRPVSKKRKREQRPPAPLLP